MEALSSKQQPRGFECEAGGGLDGEPTAADEGATPAVAGAKQAEDEARSSSWRSCGAVLSANGLGDGGDELRCRRGEANERDGGGRGAGAYSNAGVEGFEPLGVAVATDLPRPEEGGRVGRRRLVSGCGEAVGNIMGTVPIKRCSVGFGCWTD